VQEHGGERLRDEHERLARLRQARVGPRACERGVERGRRGGAQALQRVSEERRERGVERARRGVVRRAQERVEQAEERRLRGRRGLVRPARRVSRGL
jgi:hypothetical protein